MPRVRLEAKTWRMSGRDGNLERFWLHQVPQGLSCLSFQRSTIEGIEQLLGNRSTLEKGTRILFVSQGFLLLF